MKDNSDIRFNRILIFEISLEWAVSSDIMRYLIKNEFWSTKKQVQARVRFNTCTIVQAKLVSASNTNPIKFFTLI